jgi:hypothetical protein
MKISMTALFLVQEFKCKQQIYVIPSPAKKNEPPMDQDSNILPFVVVAAGCPSCKDFVRRRRRFAVGKFSTGTNIFPIVVGYRLLLL